MAPLTGEGMQKFCKKATLRVITIPTISAKAPMPAVCIISSLIVVIPDKAVKKAVAKIRFFL